MHRLAEMIFPVTICVVLGLSNVINPGECSGSNFWRIRKLVEEQRWYDIEVKETNTLYFTPVQTDYVTQPLDHFDASNQDKTFRQKLLINTQHWKPDGPVFLVISGEGRMPDASANKGNTAELAEKYNALVVAAEHRFYGTSINDGGLELESLVHLSSQQALADLEGVYQYITQKYKLTEVNTWICFGGSYSGNLAAWFRLKYPHIVYGAVASSAPVHAVTNFEMYNDVVAKSLADPTVGGNEECEIRIQQAFVEIDSILKQGSHGLLEGMFHSCDSIKDPKDSWAFTANLADIVSGVVQYNNEVPGLNIDGICDIMAGTSDTLRNLASLNEQFMKMSNLSCVNNTYTDYVKDMMNTTIDRQKEGPGIRAWIWQTCTQFGYYQTCDKNTKCPFSKLNTLAVQLQMCQDIYKIPTSIVDKFVTFTNGYYGSNQLKASRILFPNGSIDPWHALSITQDLSETVQAVFINGTAHCKDMQTSKKDDPQPLKDARMKISSVIGGWLNRARMEINKRK